MKKKEEIKEEIVIMRTSHLIDSPVGKIPWEKFANNHPTVTLIDTNHGETPTYKEFESNVIDGLKTNQKYNEENGGRFFNIELNFSFNAKKNATYNDNEPRYW